MKKKTRKILFFFFASLFLFTAPTLVFYSQGYRFDFEKKKIVQTGGLFLKALPRQAEIFLNDKLVKKTDPLFGSVLIDNLLPKKYKVRVEKEGYHPWEKNLEIKEKEVTAARYILLPPREIKFFPLFENVENFWFLPKLKKILFEEKKENGWSLKWYDVEKNLGGELINKEKLSQKKAELLNIELLEEEEEIFLSVETEEGRKDFILKLEKLPPLVIEKEPEEKKENILTSKKFKGDLYFLDGEGNLFKNELKLNETPFFPSKAKEYQLVIVGDQILLRENEALYFFNWNLKSFQQISEKVKDFQISPDLKKLAYFSDHEIWVFFLKEEALPQKRTPGEKIFLARFSEKINSLSWVNPYYLIFTSGKKIKMAEIDDRDKINITDLAEFENPKIAFNPTTKKIYLLSKETLFHSETIVKSF